MGLSLGKIVGTVGGPIGGIVTGEGLFGGLKDVVLGKKDPGQAANTIDLRDDATKAAQASAMGQYSNMLNQDPSGLANQTIQNQQNQVRQNAQDMTKVAEQEVAKRGLGGTSLGLNHIIGQQSGLADKLGNIQAQKPLLENQLRQENLNTATNGINSLLNAKSNATIYQPAVASKGRQGGLAPLIGAGVGAYFGGPAGAQAGMGIGQAATQLG